MIIADVPSPSPSFVDQIVRYSAPIFAKSARPRVRAAGPTIAGLAFVPALVSTERESMSDMSTSDG